MLNGVQAGTCLEKGVRLQHNPRTLSWPKELLYGPLGQCALVGTVILGWYAEGHSPQEMEWVSLWSSQVSESGVHRPHVAGIHGRSNDGAYSLVLAGGYEDDVVSTVPLPSPRLASRHCPPWLIDGSGVVAGSG